MRKQGAFSIVMLQLILHLVGDYITQSDWMAQRKTKSSLAAGYHAFVYTLGFLIAPWLLLHLSLATGKPVPMEVPSLLALLVIGVTHFFLDRFRLARYLVWAKNYLAPSCTHELIHESIPNVYPSVPDTVLTRVNETRWWLPWSECSKTGYADTTPPWLAVWLMIAVDNTIHLLINWLALWYL